MLLHYEMLRVDPEVQQRQALSEATIREYADLLKDGHDLGRIVVFEDTGNGYWLADGFHRVAAARQIGLEELPAVCYPGDQRAAILYACGANKHGVGRKPEDKRHAVLSLIQDQEWGQWSDNAIAKHCGVTQPFVSKLRRSLKTVISETQLRTYTTRHGTTATMQTGRIGRSKAQPPTPAEDQAATPAVLADGSSVLVHAPTSLENGSTPRRRESDLTVQAPTPPDPGSNPPADQQVPAWDLDAIVQESIHTLGEIGSQLGLLAEDYRSFTDAEGMPFPSAWACITAPLPYGRGCDLEGLLARVAPLVTLLERLQGHAEAATTLPVPPLTHVQHVRQVLPDLPLPFDLCQVAEGTGLTPEQARRALRSLVEAKEVYHVPGKRGWYTTQRPRGRTR